MKVAFRISKMGFGGAERVFLSVANELATKHQCEIQFIVDKAGVGSTESLVIDKGFKLINLGCSNTLKTILPLRKYIDKERPDILISAYTDTNFAAIISTKIARNHTKVIVSEHASLKEHWQYASLIRRVKLFLYVKFAYRFADHVLAVSAGIASQLANMGLPTKNLSYIHNPVRFNRQPKQSGSVAKSETPVVLAVGRITKQKDYLTLIKAFQILMETTNARLIIVGGVHDDVEKQKLDQAIALNQLSSNIEFVGFTEEVAVYYQKADIFVLSSAWEGFGNVIVEALAFGLPVVSTDCNHGPAEILVNGQYGKLVPVGDYHAMANAMREIADNNIFPPANQTERAQQFSEAKIADAYYSLLSKVSKQNRHNI